MTLRSRFLAPLASALAVAACHGGSATPSSTIVTAADTQAYSGIAPDEVVHFTGTEPFWGGQVAGQSLTYTTPDNRKGETIAVDRFAGRDGISFSGDLGDMPFVLAVTPGQCSDGMSDRRYRSSLPFR
jgi:uncharacterized membrane protein